MKRLWITVKRNCPRMRFLTLHYAYFLIVCLVSSVIFWATSTPSESVRYVDSVFLAVSAMTGAGLNTVNLSVLNTFQQLLLFFLIILGSPIWVSIGVLLVRQRAFEKEFSNVRREQYVQQCRRSRSNTDSPRSPLPEIACQSYCQDRISEHCGVESDLKRSLHAWQQLPAGTPKGKEVSRDRVSPQFENSPGKEPPLALVSPDAHVRSAGGGGWLPPTMTLGIPPVLEHPPIPCEENDPLALQCKVGRNPAFPHLTRKERRRLGGVEYHAVSLLATVVPIYFILCQLLGGLGVGAYIAGNKTTITEMNGLNAWWTGFFFAISAFNNSGLSLVDANMVPFQSSIYMLITMGLLILAGNTCYPIFLRAILSMFLHILPNNDYGRGYRQTLRFLLDYPRRCYTHLFPSRHTWWLLCAVIVLNGIDWAAFEVLNIDNPAITTIPLGPRILDGLFQALCVRTGGFDIVSIPSLQIGTQVIYVVMMYLSAYPVVITMRSTTVYEERSLGIYPEDPPPNLDRQETRRLSFVKQQLRAQLAHDIWWLALAVIIVSVVEAGSFTRDPVTSSVFNSLFETISAYGCVGITTGVPDRLYSFSGGWHSLSKLVLCAVMLRGRHRSLPVAIDKAIMLPGDGLAPEEVVYSRVDGSVGGGCEKV
ncbi:cation transport protein-domain-containing protein [Aspergillus coremiiformis]|uniref:Cation transport protein-domain-containing protein n=1 Tax=Aspergillus coremiiformis TaxID=138285 RepID=A0A5N6YZD6_9EURO|nr:cation transport protein-domain-containing protein [Aspergillus coremiiformis]